MICSRTGKRNYWFIVTVTAFLVAVLAVGGCTSPKEVEINGSDYLGFWVPEWQVDRSIDEFSAQGGTILEITTARDGMIEGSITLFYGPPAYPVAIATFAGELKDGKADFSFQDSWMNEGNGSLIFNKGSIATQITIIEYAEMANWSIPTGETVFVRARE